MQFKLTPLISVAAFAAPTLAQVIPMEGFASTVTCIGSAFGCTSTADICCSFPAGFGFSVDFENLPEGAQGQGYTDTNCTDFLFSLFGPGTKCFTGGSTRTPSINWIHSPQGRRASQAREEETTAGNCSVPAYFKYEDTSGAERKIKVPPAEGAAQTIADQYLAGDLTALASYEDY